MSTVPTEPNPRTVAIGQHRIESAVAFWRNGAMYVRSEPEPRATAYRRAVAQILATLQPIANVPDLLTAYYTVSAERWRTLALACDSDTGNYPLSKGITEDAAYYGRLQELIAANNSQQGGPFPAPPQTPRR